MYVGERGIEGKQPKLKVVCGRVNEEVRFFWHERPEVQYSAA